MKAAYRTAGNSNPEPCLSFLPVHLRRKDDPQGSRAEHHRPDKALPECHFPSLDEIAFGTVIKLFYVLSRRSRLTFSPRIFFFSSLDMSIASMLGTAACRSPIGRGKSLPITILSAPKNS